MSVTNSIGSDFLELENPNFKLENLIPNQSARPNDSLIFQFRETLMSQPPLGKNEYLPSSLSLYPGELALSRLPTTGYEMVEEIGLHVPARHVLMANLIRQELADVTLKNPHGTWDAYREGCTGPLCRRANRENRNEEMRLRKERRNANLARLAGRPYRPSKPAETISERIRNAWPQYIAVDPLQMAFIIQSLLAQPPRKPTREGRIVLTLTTNELRFAFLSTQYPGLVK